MEPIGVIIVAGGNGHRMGNTRPKQFMLLDTQPILAHTINAFATALPGAKIIVVLPEAHVDFWRNLAARFTVAPHTITVGGDQRFDSVRAGLAIMPDDRNLVAVHDGARPLVTHELILRTIAQAEVSGAAIPVVEPTDSFRQIDGEASYSIDRSLLRAVQTPQVFRAEILRAAYNTPYTSSFTDDASVVEHAGIPVSLCMGERRNIKITTTEDLLLAQAILTKEQDMAAEQATEMISEQTSKQ